MDTFKSRRVTQNETHNETSNEAPENSDRETSEANRGRYLWSYLSEASDVLAWGEPCEFISWRRDWLWCNSTNIEWSSWQPIDSVIIRRSEHPEASFGKTIWGRLRTKERLKQQRMSVFEGQLPMQEQFGMVMTPQSLNMSTYEMRVEFAWYNTLDTTTEFIEVEDRMIERVSCESTLWTFPSVTLKMVMERTEMKIECLNISPSDFRRGVSFCSVD